MGMFMSTDCFYLVDMTTIKTHIIFLVPPRSEAQKKSDGLKVTNVETRYTLIAYCVDLKPAISKIWEFRLVEKFMTIFEMISGCKMHRTPASQKCKFLSLGKWKTDLPSHHITSLTTLIIVLAPI